MGFRRPSGKPRPGEVKPQNLIRTGVAVVTGSLVIDPKLAVKKRGGAAPATTSVQDYEIIGVHFEDAGGVVAEDSQRPSALKNSNGTFTIYVEGTTDGLAWVPSVVATSVRWTIMLT